MVNTTKNNCHYIFAQKTCCFQVFVVSVCSSLNQIQLRLNLNVVMTLWNPQTVSQSNSFDYHNPSCRKLSPWNNRLSAKHPSEILRDETHVFCSKLRNVRLNNLPQQHVSVRGGGFARRTNLWLNQLNFGETMMTNFCAGTPLRHSRTKWSATQFQMRKGNLCLSF